MNISPRQLPLATALAIASVLMVSACGSTSIESTTTSTVRSTRPGAAYERLDQIAAQVDAWAGSSDLGEARSHAEAAANLVVGSGGLGYGDRDGDGVVTGKAEEGLLPGLAGTPAGIILTTIGGVECVSEDVLGGEFHDAAERWRLLDEAINEWAPNNNTFPTLPSHPMRIVGWATLTQMGTFDQAIEFAGHAELHVNVTRDSLQRC